MKKWLTLLFLLSPLAHAEMNTDQLDKNIAAVKPAIIEWRRYLHQHPELSNNEINTAAFVASHLKSWGIETRTGVAKTGVVGILKGDKPGPIIGLRADMDALPIQETTHLPFAANMPVMHACGHDTHVAILLGTAKILSQMKNELAGTVVFIFQPAEEGPPDDSIAGAQLMIQEGVLANPKIEAMFGLHIVSNVATGNIVYKSGAAQASADSLDITIKGKPTHGAMPWLGVDPIVVGAQVILGLQTIVSRQEDLSKAPAVITIGKLQAGVRKNIISDELSMSGTIRMLDSKMQSEIHDRIKRTVTKIAEASGATAVVKISPQTLVNYNNPELTRKVLPLLQKAVGTQHVKEIGWVMPAEDFSYFSAKIPTLFFDLGGMQKDTNPEQAPPHHTTNFTIDDSGLDSGVKAFCYLVLGYPTV